MKKKALWKEFFMEIRKSLPRFLSIFFIVALGTAFYAGIQSAAPDMRKSGDAYFDEKNLMHLKAVGTLGLTEEDVSALEALPYIEKAEPAYITDVLSGEEQSRAALRVESLQGEQNLLSLEAGAFPVKAGECLVDFEYAADMGYQVGDTIEVEEDVKEDEEILKTHTFTITGIGSSPLYISFARGNTNIGNGEIAGFVYVPAETFDADCYMEIYMQVEGAAEAPAFQKEYDDLIAKAKAQVEGIQQERCEIRYASIKGEAEEKLADAKEELADGKKEAEEKLADAREEIADAEQKLADGRQELEDAAKELEEGKQELAAKKEELADAKAQIDDGWTQLARGKKQLKEKEKTYQKEKKSAEKKIKQGEKELAKGKEQLSAGKQAYEAQKAQYEAGKQEYEQNLAAYEAQKTAFENGAEGITAEELAGWKTVLDATSAQIAEGGRQLEQAKGELDAAKKQIAASEKELKNGKEALSAGKKQLEAARKELKKQEEKLAGAQAELTDGEQKIREAEQELADGEQKIKDGEAEIAEHEQELADGKQEYEDAKKEAEETIADGEKKIADAEKEIRKIKKAKWTISDRSDLPEYTGYGENADRMRNIGRVFPVIFFLVAALISLTTMTRMVEEQRTQIGTLKALGYKETEIAAKYIGYALAATLGGSIFGVLIGEKILPFIIIRAYGIMYQHMDALCIPYNLTHGVTAAAAAVCCTLAAAAEACGRELRAWPAALMRPAAPAKGKRVLLERIGIVWDHLNFTWKSTIRNLFRYKKRFFMTILGISGCMGLLLVGFGLRDSIMDVAVIQYREIQIYDGQIILDEDAYEAEKEALKEELDADAAVTAYTDLYMKKVDLCAADAKRETFLMVLPDDTEVEKFVRFQTRKGKTPFSLTDNGMILTEKTAKLLNVSEGGSVFIGGEQKEIQIPVERVCENYMSHYAYMTESLYRRLYGEKPEYNSILYTTAERDEKTVQEAGERAMRCDAALSVSYTCNLKEQIDHMLGSLDSVILVLIVSAGMLAFLVLYNLNNININERKRELATLKVLGFYDGEVAGYVYRENILLTVIGCICGIFAGILMHRFIIVTVEVDVCMFGRSINPVSFVWAVLLTFGFSMIVNAAMYDKVRKIDMVESLKSVE